MKYFFILALTLSLYSCATEKTTGQKYLRWVGDIEHNPEIDDKNFVLCHGENNFRQYFNMSQGMQYEGEKTAIVNYFKEKYKPVNIQESGWVRIRFIVNCQGKSSRFRMIEADENYRERPFDKQISQQLLSLTQSLKGWKIITFEDEPVDYYQYLVFKIQDGNIEKIMP